jgi:hypothetical protein
MHETTMSMMNCGDFLNQQLTMTVIAEQLATVRPTFGGKRGQCQSTRLHRDEFVNHGQAEI